MQDGGSRGVGRHRTVPAMGAGTVTGKSVLPEGHRFPAPSSGPPKAGPLKGAAAAPYGVLKESADLLAFTGRTIVACVTPPFSWRNDFIEESWLLLRRALLPVCLTVSVFAFAIMGFLAGRILELLATPDRLGGFYVFASVRHFGVWVTAMVVAGIGGSAVCADLGARKVRHELDAMAVMGLDPVRSIVAPRFLALALLTPLLVVVGVVAGIPAGLLATVMAGNSTSGFVSGMWSSFSVVDVFAGVGKGLIFGGLIAIVNCYKAMNASGGPEGVGRAVNQAVVISFTAIWAIVLVHTSLVVALFPDALTTR